MNMNKAFLFLLMIFLHIVDDYYLQGWLASAKQKEWWKQNTPDKLYKNDYIWALIMHSFSWTFMTMLPIAYFLNFNINSLFIWLFVYNVLCHGIIDNLKANTKIINLWVDQLIHMVQITTTAMCFFIEK